MNRIAKTLAAAAVAASVLTAGVAVTSHFAVAGQTAAEAPVVIGSTAPAFTLTDQDNKPVSLADYAGKVVVVEWTNPQCPFVQRHYAEKTMTTLAAKYKDKGVAWLAVNSTHDNTNEADKAWATQQAIPYPVLNDAAGTVGHAYGAKTTPHMYVIGKDGKLAYAGGIDNDPQGNKAADRVNYVAKALDQILADKPVSTPESKPYGCGVHYGG